MSNQDLRLIPHKRRKDPDSWWYEEPQGLWVVVQYRDNGLRYLHVQIPWRSLRAALKRKDKP